MKKQSITVCKLIHNTRGMNMRETKMFSERMQISREKRFKCHINNISDATRWLNIEQNEISKCGSKLIEDTRT